MDGRCDAAAIKAKHSAKSTLRRGAENQQALSERDLQFVALLWQTGAMRGRRAAAVKGSGQTLMRRRWSCFRIRIRLDRGQLKNCTVRYVGTFCVMYR